MDFKQFVCGDMTFGVGQISSMDREELDEIKGKLEPAMNELMKEKELNMLFFMLTDVMEESSQTKSYSGRFRCQGADRRSLWGRRRREFPA